MSFKDDLLWEWRIALASRRRRSVRCTFLFSLAGRVEKQLRWPLFGLWFWAAAGRVGWWCGFRVLVCSV